MMSSLGAAGDQFRTTPIKFAWIQEVLGKCSCCSDRLTNSNTEGSHEHEGKAFRAADRCHYEGNVSVGRAIGYVRVSTDMQAQEGFRWRRSRRRSSSTARCMG